MTAILFDTLKYSKGAEEVGFTKQQAEYQAEQLAKLVDEQLVTKSFLSNELLKLELRLLMKLGAMMVVSSTFTIGILGFLLKT